MTKGAVYDLSAGPSKVIWEIEYTFNHSKTGTKTEGPGVT